MMQVRLAFDQSQINVTHWSVSLPQKCLVIVLNPSSTFPFLRSC